jgi:hypothetical protein
MAKINLGMDFNQAEGAVSEERKGVPTGTYRARCFKVEVTETGPNSKKPGRPMLVFNMELVASGEFDGKEFKYWAVLPWGDVQTGLGNLIDATTALGKPWEGNEIDTDDYLMKEAEINLEEKISPNGTFTSIKSFK